MHTKQHFKNVFRLSQFSFSSRSLSLPFSLSLFLGHEEFQFSSKFKMPELLSSVFYIEHTIEREMDRVIIRNVHRPIIVLNVYNSSMERGYGKKNQMNRIEAHNE